MGLVLLYDSSPTISFFSLIHLLTYHRLVSGVFFFFSFQQYLIEFGVGSLLL